MPLVRFLVSKYYTLLAISISLNREIRSPCSCYTKKGLVYIAIATSFSCQPFSCSKYTKLNTCFSYNIHLVSVNKYIFILY